MPRLRVVEASVVGIDTLYNDETREPQQTTLAKCLRCQRPVLVRQWFFEEYLYPDGRTEGSLSEPKRCGPTRGR